MNKLQKIKLGWWFFWFDLKCGTANIRRRIWNKRILLWWYRLWIRKDEFHKSLSSDFSAKLVMTEEERDEYDKDLCRRRRIAHDRDNQR
ncbi:MAG: hypothetical protein WC087_01640 [Candidatus Paceibacterota bacterium]